MSAISVCQIANNRNGLLQGTFWYIGWLVGFGFNGPLRRYFSLYRAVSQREGRKRIEDRYKVDMVSFFFSHFAIVSNECHLDWSVFI